MFGDFGTVLLLSGAIALIGSVVAWFVSLCEPVVAALAAAEIVWCCTHIACCWSGEGFGMPQPVGSCPVGRPPTMHQLLTPSQSSSLALYCSSRHPPLPIAGVPRSELEMLQQQTAAARLAAGTQGRAADDDPAGGASGSGTAGLAGGPGAGPMAGTAGGGSQEGISEGEVDVMASPSEPVSAESTEDLQPAGGVLQVGVGWEGWRAGGGLCVSSLLQLAVSTAMHSQTRNIKRLLTKQPCL